MDQTQESPQTEQVQEEQAPDIKGFLGTLPDSPPQDQIEQWKQQYGEVLCSAFSEVEVFVWRPLTRSEFLQLQIETAQAQQAGTPFMEADLENRIVENCKLWASEAGRKALVIKGGSVSTLHEQIMLNSNFLPSPLAAAMVIKL